MNGYIPLDFDVELDSSQRVTKITCKGESIILNDDEPQAIVDFFYKALKKQAYA